MNWFWIFLSSLLAGAAASMGIGGGAVLLLYLTAFAGMNQLAAQGINLIFFLPIAVVAVIIHAKNKLLNYKSAGICIAFGLIGVFFGLWLTKVVSEEWLRRLFAILLLVLGVKDLFAKQSPKDRKGTQPPDAAPGGESPS